MPMDPNMPLSPHFSLGEMIASQTASRMGIDNTPTPEHLENLRRTAEAMERVRSALGSRPIYVSSGYRSPALNAAVGGATSSAHCIGLACDFQCPSYGTPPQITGFLAGQIFELALDQVINEYPPNGWVHVGLSVAAPRHMVLTIDSNGTRTGLA